jgi:beta-glucanase (GH16 family)
MRWEDQFDTLGSTDWGQGIWYAPGQPADSAYVSNGVLELVSRRSQGYPDVTVTTEAGANAHHWQYGYFEARMKWSKGNGAWPAFWLYSYQHAIDSNQCTTQAGEIDAFEGQGSEPNVFYGTVHSNTNGCSPQDQQNGNNYQNLGRDLTTDFHTVGVKWTPTTVTWYLDGVQTHSAPTYATDNQQMFMLFQMWIGGWTNDTDGSTPDTIETQVDYVDVWQQ